MTTPIPRLVVAGTGGDSGKTIVTLSLVAVLRERGLDISAFKKGPDYIDAAWLEWASGSPAHNLDAYIMGEDQVCESFLVNGDGADLCIVEGNRGLLDGMDARGTFSTAALASLLDAPVVLVLPATKVTRSVAAWVAGFRAMEPDVKIAGVVLNRVRGPRHARVTTAAVEGLGVPVLGVIPNLKGENPLPDRHLGLVTPSEHGRLESIRQNLSLVGQEHLDVERILELARQAPSMQADIPQSPDRPPPSVRIGVFRDSAFTFYYPDNLRALEMAGAELIPVNALADERIPDVDALLIGGGFPETHAGMLSGNEGLRNSVCRAAIRGMPIYAECGGLMYLSRSLRWEDRTYPMAGVLPFEVVMHARPRGHGYASAVVDGENPFFETGTEIRGHEFHYSTIADGMFDFSTVYAVQRGTGCLEGRDAASCKNVLAAYIHLHARGCPEWATGVVRAASRYRDG